MSVEHYMPPVIETLPPYIFTILCCSAISYGLTVCLWKNGQWLTIQVPMPPIVQCGSRELRLEYIESELKELQPFAKSLVFGKTNWAYFIRGDHGRRTIAYRKRPLYRIKYQPCVPKVHQDELTYLRPAQGNTIEVIWRGQQLDMQLGWEDATSALLERQMKAYEMLRGLDLTFELVGHVVNSDGDTIGLLSEPAFGRPFQASDIIALSDAMFRLADRGLWWPVYVDFNLMMSLDNKVRLLTYCAVRKFKDEEERELRMVELQRDLQAIYLAYKDTYRWESSYRYRHACPELIDPTYFLEWPIVLNYHSLFKERFIIGASDNPLSVNRLHYRRSGKTLPLPLAATTKVEEIGEQSTDADNDEHDALHQVVHHPKKRCKSPYHPHHRSSRRSRKLLLAPE